MDTIDLRLEILDQARRSLRQHSHLSPAETQEVLKLINVLIESSQRAPDSGGAAADVRQSIPELIQSQTLRIAHEQQADELDALKKLSLNLTSSLDLHTVLEAVAKEAMNLVSSTRAVHIFLYTNGKLEFGASLDRDGSRNIPISVPRIDGLTYAVARSGEEIIVEDIKNHPLY